jgi:ATP-binding cassette subfamily B multidrug efflux pump
MIKNNPSSIDEISGKGFDDKVVLRLLPYLRPHLLKIALALSMVFFSAGIAIYTPRLLGRIVDQALLPRDYPLLQKLVLFYACLELLRVAFVFGQSYRLMGIGLNVMQQLRRDLFARLLRMPVPFFDKNPVGKLVTRVTNDTVNLAELFSSGFVMLLSDVLLIVGVISAMIVMNWRLGLLAISVFPAMIYFMTFFSTRLRDCFRGSREVLSQLNGFYAERMQGMHIVQLMEREAFERAHYQRISQNYRDMQFAGIYLYSLFHPVITVLSAASIAIVLWYGPGFLANKEIALGTFVSFLAYVQVLYQPVRSITDRYNVYLAAMASAERIFTLMDMQEEDGVRGKNSKITAAPTSLGSLSFENVSFSYPARRQAEDLLDGLPPSPALSDVSFSVKKGETVAIVGHTGAGKTTLTSLLFRFYEPSSGRIVMGGRPLAEIPKQELRSRIGFVQQEVFLFSGTLRENLALMRRDLTDREILAGCERTGFLRIVSRLPGGLDTELDERGANLSLGERQILAFTRVFLQEPDLLVLDEASSSVDRESELLLQRASRELTKGRSALVIAHRLETVRHADRILVFERGSLIEQGNHSELLMQNGRYSRFVKLQEYKAPARGP